MSDWVTLKDTLGLTLRPIDDWPGTLRYPSQRERSPFSASLKDTLKVLKTELNALQARSIVLQIAIKEQHLRLDGLPRAGATAEHPGVILTFDSKHGPLRLHFDGFLRWEHNLRAIAMHLQNLRHAGLYGVGKDGQQYAGWKALPPPPPEVGSTVAGFASLEEAALFLVRAAGNGTSPGTLLVSCEAYKQTYRAAAHRLHPDSGGSHEAFLRLQKAAEMLKQRHGL